MPLIQMKGLEPDIIIATLGKKRKRERERKVEGKRERWNEKEGERDRKMETNVCENMGPLFRALSTPNIKLAK